MKSTGMVRRIDDLGRIAIPKEIRRAMGIVEADPLEIFVDTENGQITLKPYNQLNYKKMWEDLKKIKHHPVNVNETMTQIEEEQRQYM